MPTLENNVLTAAAEEVSKEKELLQSKEELSEDKVVWEGEMPDERRAEDILSEAKAEYVYAGFFTRFAAFCMDSILVGILLLVVRIPMLIDMMSGEGILNTKVLFEFTGWDIIIYLLTSLYYIFLTYNSGATIGKKLLRIRVVSVDGEKASFMDILYRETIGKFLSGVAMNMGYVLIGIDKEKCGFHDMLSDTRVVYDFEVQKKKKKEKPTDKNGEVITETGSNNYVAEEQKNDKKRFIPPSNYGYVSGSQKAVKEQKIEGTDIIPETALENTVKENGLSESEIILDEKIE